MSLKYYITDYLLFIGMLMLILVRLLICGRTKEKLPIELNWEFDSGEFE